MKQLPSPRATSIKRENLANLIIIPRKFHLVNEKGEPMSSNDIDGATSAGASPKFKPKHESDDYTKDQLIFAIGSALPEIATFVQEMDVLRADNAVECGIISDMHFAAVGSHREPVRGVVEDVEHLRQRFNQAMDVLKNIAFNHKEASFMRQSASAFVDIIRNDEEKSAGNIISLVNEKSKNGNEPQGV